MARINISFELSTDQVIAIRDKEEIKKALDNLWIFCGCYHGWSDHNIEVAYDDMKIALENRLHTVEEKLYSSFDKSLRYWDTEYDVVYEDVESEDDE